ncbi:MAG: hypothetical protein JRN15_09745 [Nitrososphaerota archaeon]|nr:hypothetical protein [Nitrososphaerota archaeon]
MKDEIPLKEFKRLATESVEDNMPILEALAEQDKRLTHLPRKTEAKQR